MAQFAPNSGVSFDEGASVREAGSSLLNSSAQIMQALQMKKQLAMAEADQTRTAFFENAKAFGTDPNAYLATPAGQEQYQTFLKAQGRAQNADKLFGSLFQKKGMSPEETTASMLDMNNMSVQGIAAISENDAYRQSLAGTGGGNAMSQTTPQQLASGMPSDISGRLANATPAMTQGSAQLPNATAQVMAPSKLPATPTENSSPKPNTDKLTSSYTKNLATLKHPQSQLNYKKAFEWAATTGAKNITKTTEGFVLASVDGDTFPANYATYEDAVDSLAKWEMGNGNPNSKGITTPKGVNELFPKETSTTTTAQPVEATSKELRSFFNDYAKSNPELKSVMPDYVEGKTDDGTIWKSLPLEKQEEFIKKTGTVPKFESITINVRAKGPMKAAIAGTDANAGNALGLMQQGAQEGTPQQKLSLAQALAKTGNNYSKALQLLDPQTRQAINASAVQQVMNKSSLQLQLSGATTLADRQAALEQIRANLAMVQMQMSVKALGEDGLQTKDMLEHLAKEDETLSKQEADAMSTGKYKTSAAMYLDHPIIQARRNNLTAMQKSLYTPIIDDTGLNMAYDRWQAEQSGMLWWKKTALNPEDTSRSMRSQAASSTATQEDAAFNSFMGN